MTEHKAGYLGDHLFKLYYILNFIITTRLQLSGINHRGLKYNAFDSLVTERNRRGSAHN